MQCIDEILNILGDSRWHKFDDLKQEIQLPADKLNELIRFLQEQELITKDNEELRITTKGFKFLELPL